MYVSLTRYYGTLNNSWRANADFYEQIFAPDVQNSTETKEVVVFTCISTLEFASFDHQNKSCYPALTRFWPLLKRLWHILAVLFCLMGKRNSPPFSARLKQPSLMHGGQKRRQRGPDARQSMVPFHD